MHSISFITMDFDLTEILWVLVYLYPEIVAGAFVALFVLYPGWNALLRRLTDVPVFRPNYDDVLLSLDWVTLRGSLFGFAPRCAWFVLTPDFFQVGLHFPFNVFAPMWVSRMLGFEGRVTLDKIVSVEKTYVGLGGSMVNVSWREEHGTRSILLKVRERDAFAGRLRELAWARGGAI
jgi:hypothetical protein